MLSSLSWDSFRNHGSVSSNPLHIAQVENVEVILVAQAFPNDPLTAKEDSKIPTDSRGMIKTRIRDITPGWGPLPAILFGIVAPHLV